MSRKKLSDRGARHDPYHQRAKREGYAARSIFKLEEIDERFKIIQPGSRILDLGCRPGSWLQYCQQRRAVALVKQAEEKTQKRSAQEEGPLATPYCDTSRFLYQPLVGH